MNESYWYVCKKVNVATGSVKPGDVIGFKRKNPNISSRVNGNFVPTCDWIYIGKWETPPIEDLQEAVDLIRAGGKDESN